MLDYNKFCDLLDSVSVSNFGVPVQRLLKQKLFDYFVYEEEHIFEIVMDEILKENKSISYFNIYHRLEKHKQYKTKHVFEEVKPKIAYKCEDRECHICDVDICYEVTNAFKAEWNNLWHRTESKEHSEAMERLKQLFPNLKWDSKKIKSITVNINGEKTINYT